MTTDTVELRIRRLLGEWVRNRPEVNISLHDYLSLVEVFTDVLSDDPSPIEVQAPINDVYCEVCSTHITIPLGKHLWAKHRMKLADYATYKKENVIRTYQGYDDVEYQDNHNA